MHAIQAESAIHVPHFQRLEQCQFTPALDHDQLGTGSAPPANAIFRPAIVADLQIAHLHFERRNRGSHEIELSDRTNKFVERRTPAYASPGGPRQKEVDVK